MFSWRRRSREEQITFEASLKTGSEPTELMKMNVGLPETFSSSAKERVAEEMAGKFAAAVGARIVGRQQVNGGQQITIHSNETSVSDNVVKLPRRRNW